MPDNLPPLPHTSKPAPPKVVMTAYILRDRDYVEIGTGWAHEDGKGYKIRLDIAPEDGDIIELRALEPEHYPAGKSPSKKPAPKRKKSYDYSKED